MRGRSLGTICLLSVGCVLDATGGGSDAKGGGAGTVTSSSTAESAASTAESTTSGVVPACGDGVVGPFEPCDDGGVVDGDGCSALCTVEMGFVCRGTPSECTLCGDGLVLKGETCEDGNERGDDGCNGCNAIATCGNDVVEPTEACDQRSDPTKCTSECTFAPGSECTTAIDLDPLSDPIHRRGLYDGNTIGSTDTRFPEHLINAPNNQGLGMCTDAGKPRDVPTVKHRFTTGPYPSLFDARVTFPVGAPDANLNPMAWAYRGCDVSTLDVVCNDNTLDVQPALRTPPLPPLSTVVMAVSGYAPTHVGRYTLHYREITLPWQEGFTELPVAGDLEGFGLTQLCHDNCGVLDVCEPPGCPDGHFLQVEDPAGGSQGAHLTSPTIAWQGREHVDLELRHETTSAVDATLTVLVSTDGITFVPVKTMNAPFKRRELVELFPAQTPPDTFRVRVQFQGSTGAAVGVYKLGLARVRVFSDLP